VVATTIKRGANMGYNAILIKDATSGFTDSNYSAMLDILPLYAKVISSAEFTLKAPYGGTARQEQTASLSNSRFVPFTESNQFAFKDKTARPAERIREAGNEQVS